MKFLRHLAVAAALVGTIGAAQAADKVKLVFGSPWNPTESYIPFGIALGFFAEENIEIEPLAVQGAAVMVPQLSQANVDFGSPPPDFFIVAADKGEPFNARFVFNYYSSSAFEFVVPENSPIKTLADLKGKKLGVGALGWGNLPMTRTILKDAGVEWQTDVTPVPVGVGPAAWASLKDGKVDALNLFVHQHEMMQAAGTKIRRLAVPEKYDRLFANGFAISDRIYKENPKQVEGMLRAVARSMTACNAYPENCVRAYWAFDPSTKPTADKEAEWIALYAAINKAGQGKAHRFQKPGKLGEYDANDWNNLIAAMKDGGQIKAGSLPLDRLYTNEFIAKANDFDMQKTLEKAKNYK